MNSKYKKAVLICPATINAMEDSKNNIESNKNNIEISKNNKNENLKEIYKSFISINNDKNIPNLFQTKTAKCNLLSQMNNILEKSINLEVVKKFEKYGNKYVIDNNFIIIPKEDHIEIHNTFTNNKSATPISIYNDKILVGNDTCGVFEINTNKQKEFNNNDTYINYLKYTLNNKNYYFIRKNNFSYDIIDSDNNSYITNSNTKIDKENNIFINNSIFHTQISTNIKDTPFSYKVINSIFFITIIGKDTDKKIFISSSKDEIKITLITKDNALVFNLFLTDKTKDKFTFSYFKNSLKNKEEKEKEIFFNNIIKFCKYIKLNKNFNKCKNFNDLENFFEDLMKEATINKLEKSMEEFNIYYKTDGDVFRLLNGKPFSFYTKKPETNAKFKYDNVDLNCYLNGNIGNYILESIPNRNIFYKNLNKEKDIIITFNDNIKYDHLNRIFINNNNNNNNNTLYNLDNNYYITYLDNFLGINFKFNAYNKIKITDKKNNIINFEKYNKKNITLENLKKSYDDFLSKTEIFREYFNILTKLYKEEIEKVDNNDIVNNYTIDQICRIYEKLISENNNDDNKNEINKNIILDKIYSTNDILDLLKNCNHLKNNIINSVKDSENKKNYEIKFVNDIIVNEESLEKNLIDKNNIINQNILKLLNSGEDNITLIEYLYKISKGIIPTYKETLKGNLESIIHIYYNNKLRLFFKYNHKNNIAEVYKDLTHTEKGINEN